MKVLQLARTKQSVRVQFVSVKAECNFDKVTG